jgi:hypothetical protein
MMRGADAMDENERLIFQKGKAKPVTKKKHEKSLEPYEQQVELFSNLEAWCAHAVEILRKSGYSETYEETEGMTESERLALIKKPRLISYGSIYKLTWIPQALLSNVDAETKAADDVLRSIHNLHEAIFQNDKNRIANAGIDVGVAVASAHAYRYEKDVVSAKNSSQSFKNRDDQLRKGAFEEWLQENYEEKVKHLQTMKEILKIDRIASIPVKGKTIRKWFKEFYPNHCFRIGRPKKN